MNHIREQTQIHFIYKINKKMENIKFYYKFSKEKLKHLAALVYKDRKSRLQTTL